MIKSITLSKIAIVLSIVGATAGVITAFKIGEQYGFKEGQDFIVFTTGENQEEIIEEIRQERQKELTDFATKQKASYGKTHR